MMRGDMEVGNRGSAGGSELGGNGTARATARAQCDEALQHSATLYSRVIGPTLSRLERAV
jgi:hypothetical protein